MRVEAVHVYYVNHPWEQSHPTPYQRRSRSTHGQTTMLNSRRTPTRHVQHPHASMSSRLRAGQMQHIRSRLGRAVTTRARHTHTAQARLRTRPGTQSASPRVVAGPHLAPVVHTAVQSQLRCSIDEPSPRSRPHSSTRASTPISMHRARVGPPVRRTSCLRSQSESHAVRTQHASCGGIRPSAPQRRSPRAPHHLRSLSRCHACPSPRVHPRAPASCPTRPKRASPLECSPSPRPG